MRPSTRGVWPSRGDRRSTQIEAGRVADAGGKPLEVAPMMGLPSPASKPR